MAMRTLGRFTTSILLVISVGFLTGPSPNGVLTSALLAQSSEELDKLLAPIALYPDSLLSQILLCSADPGQVVDLKNWMAKNTQLKGTALQDEATASNFEPSFVALVLFPQVVNQMAADQAWTTKLGQAFEKNREGVFASIQRLRAQAQKVGTLKDSPQQNVESKTTSSGQQVIVIEPTNPQVVYVPQYNPQVVYTTAPTTVVVQEDDDDAAEAVAAGLIGFTAGIAIGAAMDNDYYYGPYGWGGGFAMYNEAWDDWYDHREDAREDWMDHREDVMENRGERTDTRQEQRTDRTESRQNTRGDTQTQRTERQSNRQENRPAQTQQRSSTTQAATQSSAKRSSEQARGYSSSGASTQSAKRSGTGSDAFSGYSSGKSTKAASSRGQASRSSSRGGGGGGGGGRRR
jgi:hypothetical protein